MHCIWSSISPKSGFRCRRLLISLFQLAIARVDNIFVSVDCSSNSFSPVHASNNVEATVDFVEKYSTLFKFIARNNVERVYRKISSFRQSRNKLNMFNLFRYCRNDEILFKIVAKPATMSKQKTILDISAVT